jgi:protein-tyrosine phosphatase
MDQVLPRLYLGNVEDAEQVSAVQCPCVITLCERAPVLRDPGIAHIHAPIPDEVYLEPPIWSELVHALTVAMRDESAVLVHCRLGVSRAPSLVAAYLARHGWTLETALALLVSRRSVVAPHSETWRGVVAWYQGGV